MNSAIHRTCKSFKFLRVQRQCSVARDRRSVSHAAASRPVATFLVNSRRNLPGNTPSYAFSNTANENVFFSTSNDNEVDVGGNISNSTPTSPPSQSQQVFPWRENAVSPLPRLSTNDDLSGFNKTSNSKFSIKLACAIELKEFSLWSFFVSRQWEKELAKNASWGFQTAVSGLISRTFGIPLHLIENTLEDGLVVDSTTSAVSRDMALDHDEKNKMNDENTKATESDANEEDVEDSTEFIQNMIESNLLSLYKPIHENENSSDENNTSTKHNEKQYQITFCLKPVSSRLENIFMIPSLTRQDVEHNPSLKGAYMAIDQAWRDKASVEEIGDMSRELTRKTSHFGTKRSIIMDVAIDCAEIFQIKDVKSGQIIQGQGKEMGESDSDDNSSSDHHFNDLDLEPEMTTHLVRFEMVTSKGQRSGERKVGSWYVIDIDDMLKGNTWH